VILPDDVGVGYQLSDRQPKGEGEILG
jgi:hypothetical protein